MAIQHTYRTGRGNETETRALTPLKAIRAHCIECMGGSRTEPTKCTAPLCALYPFREGDSHAGGREMTEEERARAAERLRRYRGERG